MDHYKHFSVLFVKIGPLLSMDEWTYSNDKNNPTTCTSIFLNKFQKIIVVLSKNKEQHVFLLAWFCNLTHLFPSSCGLRNFRVFK